jgi:hypothetical protein
MQVSRVTGLAALIVVVIATICVGIMRAQDLFRRAGPFDLHIMNVRSLGPEKNVGFSKSLELYAVTGYGQQMSYVLYCTKVAPDSGRVYTALDEYVISDLSPLHLWPVERSTLDLPQGAKKRGRLYRVIIIQNIASGPKPDLACDIHSEQALSPNPQ